MRASHGDPVAGRALETARGVPFGQAQRGRGRATPLGSSWTDQSPETGPSLSPGPGQGVQLTGNDWGARTPSSGAGGAETTAHPSGSTGPSLSPGPGQGAVETASTSIATS